MTLYTFMRPSSTPPSRSRLARASLRIEDRSRYAHGTILSAALLLRHSLGLEEEATAVERAVDDVIAGGARTADIASPIERPLSTSELGRPVRTALGEETAVERAS